MLYLSDRQVEGILDMRKARRGLKLIRKETWMKVKDPGTLRRKRMNQRFSQRDLAALVRRSQNTIHLLETGQMKTLSEDLAILIAARLHVDWEDLFDLEEHEIAPIVTNGARISTDSSEGKLRTA